jgi:PilZ domain-containing protein
MDAGLSPARQARAHHRHDLRTLTYVTLDQANGGIVRNINHEGIGVQVVAAVRPRQQLRVRFELRYPKLRVETRGEVIWATFSGQCGIRFLDLSPRTARQINEWILGNLLEGATLNEDRFSTIFGEADRREAEHSGTLTVSGTPVKVIELPNREEPKPEVAAEAELPEQPAAELDWLSQPLSGRGLAWTVNSLAVVAALLLFSLVFLFVTRELPKWPVSMLMGAAIFVAAFYWGFFKLFGGTSPGARLARLAGYQEDEEEMARFR